MILQKIADYGKIILYFKNYTFVKVVEDMEIFQNLFWQV